MASREKGNVREGETASLGDCCSAWMGEQGSHNCGRRSCFYSRLLACGTKSQRSGRLRAPDPNHSKI